MKKKITFAALTLFVLTLLNLNSFGQKRKDLEFPDGWKGFNGTLLVVDEYEKGPYHEKLNDYFTSIFTGKVMFISQIDTNSYKPQKYPFIIHRDFKSSGPYKGAGGGTGSFFYQRFCLLETSTLSGACTKSLNQNKWEKGLKQFVEQLEAARK